MKRLLSAARFDTNATAVIRGMPHKHSIQCGIASGLMRANDQPMRMLLLAIGLFVAILISHIAAGKPADPSKMPASGRAAFFEEHIVWQNKEESACHHHVYGLVRAKSGTLLAFTEARKGEGNDADPHHLVLKRSMDGGRTWSRNIYLETADGSFWATNGQPDKLECWTNPGPVADEQTGRVFFFYALNEGSKDQKFTRVFYRYSDDDGITWLPSSKAGGRIEATHLFTDNPYGWTFHMPGPGHGIQLRHQRGKQAKKNGRLVLAVWHRRAVTASPRLYGVSTLVSDDHGKTWRRAGDTGISHGMGEGRLVELEDGRILLNARGGPAEKVNTQKHRVYAWSGDSGETFGAPVIRTEFEYSGNGCDSGFQRYPITASRDKSVLLFSRPADPERRARMTVSWSLDEGQTWAQHKLIHDGPGFYSDLVVLTDGTIGLLYGTGTNRWWPDHVAFARFNFEWLTNPNCAITNASNPTWRIRAIEIYKCLQIRACIV